MAGRYTGLLRHCTWRAGAPTLSRRNSGSTQLGKMRTSHYPPPRYSVRPSCRALGRIKGLETRLYRRTQVSLGVQDGGVVYIICHADGVQRQWRERFRGNGGDCPVEQSVRSGRLPAERQPRPQREAGRQLLVESKPPLRRASRPSTLSKPPTRGLV